jgi:cleavage and polyadenylation specificity factor subunit 1
VDDVVVRSQKRSDHIQDLWETFANLRRYGLKLNLEKCVFGVRRGKLLGCMISKRGIEANPKKIEAIWCMKAPRTQREVQKLAGRLASLNRFILKSAERSLPFFKALKGNSTF